MHEPGGAQAADRDPAPPQTDTHDIRHVVRALVALLAIAMVSASLALVGVTPAGASGGEVSYTAYSPNRLMTWGNTFSVPRFDASRGRLVRVVVDIAGNVAATARFENRNPYPVDTSAEIAASLRLTSVDVTGLDATARPTTSRSVSLGAFDGVVDYAGTSGRTFAALAGTARTSTDVTDPTLLARFTGTGAVRLTMRADNASIPSPDPNVTTQIAATSEATTTIRYVYERAAVAITITPPSQRVDLAETARFTVSVTNTGVVTLSSTDVIDRVAPSCDRTLGSLAPGATVRYTCELVNVRSDTSGSITATAVSTEGETISASASRSVVVNRPAARVTGTVSATEVLVGRSVSATATIANVGNVGLTAISLSIAGLPASCARTVAALDPNQSATVSCSTGPLTGSTTLSFAGSALTPGGVTLIERAPSQTVTVRAAALAVTVTADRSVYRPGDVAGLTVDIRSFGNAETNLGVRSLNWAIDGLTDCRGPVPDLAPGASMQVRCVTPPLDASRSVAASVSGSTSLGNLFTASAVPVLLTVLRPELTVAVVADPPVVPVGGGAHLTVRIDNTGDTPLGSISLTVAGAPACTMTTGSVAPGQRAEVSCITPRLGAPTVFVARASGTDDGGTPVIGMSPEVTVDLASVGLGVVVTPRSGPVEPGDVLPATLTVTNTGATSLLDVLVTPSGFDACTPSPDNLPGSLASGATLALTCHAVVRADTSVFGGAATATAAAPLPVAVRGDARPVTVTITTPRLDARLDTASPEVGPGDSGVVDLLVSNPGPLAVSGLDPVVAGATCDPVDPTVTLGPSTQRTIRCVTAPLTAGVTLRAVVHGRSPAGHDVVAVSDALTITVLVPEPAPALTLSMLVDGRSAPGAPGVVVPAGTDVVIDLEILNTGVVAVQLGAGVSLLPGVDCPVTGLEPGETTTCRGHLDAHVGTTRLDGFARGRTTAGLETTVVASVFVTGTAPPATTTTTTTATPTTTTTTTPTTTTPPAATTTTTPPSSTTTTTPPSSTTSTDPSTSLPPVSTTSSTDPTIPPVTPSSTTTVPDTPTTTVPNTPTTTVPPLVVPACRAVPDLLVGLRFTVAGTSAADLRQLGIGAGELVEMGWTGWRAGYEHCDLSLVAYRAPQATFEVQAEQTLYQASRCIPPLAAACRQPDGTFVLRVTVPADGTAFQVDAVVGAPLATVGPIGGYYAGALNGGVDRLISAQNGPTRWRRVRRRRSRRVRRPVTAPAARQSARRWAGGC